jgi:hypothetical protein
LDFLVFVPASMPSILPIATVSLGISVVVLQDFTTTPEEPGYLPLSSYVHDGTIYQFMIIEAKNDKH